MFHEKHQGRIHKKQEKWTRGTTKRYKSCDKEHHKSATKSTKNGATKGQRKYVTKSKTKRATAFQGRVQQSYLHVFSRFQSPLKLKFWKRLPKVKEKPQEITWEQINREKEAEMKETEVQKLSRSWYWEQKAKCNEEFQLERNEKSKVKSKEKATSSAKRGGTRQDRPAN